mmetsp:Transcript_78488/g.233867  ORF Transcript_78488/g.233867 Transcript_78488/m.233867 type:complete len:229 (+) Transcript_78488:418-1104(+)
MRLTNSSSLDECALSVARSSRNRRRRPFSSPSSRSSRPASSARSRALREAATTSGCGRGGGGPRVAWRFASSSRSAAYEVETSSNLRTVCCRDSSRPSFLSRRCCSMVLCWAARNCDCSSASSSSSPLIRCSSAAPHMSQQSAARRPSCCRTRLSASLRMRVDSLARQSSSSDRHPSLTRAAATSRSQSSWRSWYCSSCAAILVRRVDRVSRPRASAFILWDTCEAKT